MDFTREPIIETIITPKEGCKLVVRSSKSTGQEEYFVDSVEVVSFGHSFFFRSLERPKSFLVPVSDYEILEVREARMVLKNVGLDRSIKIAGGREGGGGGKGSREPVQEKAEPAHVAEELVSAAEGSAPEGKVDKKRERRRHSRRRRGRDDLAVKEGEEEFQDEGSTESRVLLAPPNGGEKQVEGGVSAQMASPSSVISSLLPPPTTLISETIARYKDNELFKGAFFLKEGEPTAEGADSEQLPRDSLAQPELGSYEASDDEAEEIFRLRASQDHIIPGSYTLSGEPFSEEPPAHEPESDEKKDI